MPSFAISICVLTLVQATVVLLPARRDFAPLARLRSGWWAALPALSVVAFVFGVRAAAGAATGLTYLALVAVPPLAALALAAMVRGARPGHAALAAALFALAWVDRGGLVGESAGVVLDALSCVALAVLLVAVSPRVLVKVGILAMAAVDVWLVASDLLNAPNSAVNGVVPPAHLPQLQSAVFGSAVIGYGDLFIAALLGALLVSQSGSALRGAALTLLLGLAMNLLFLLVSELPATVPVALALIVLELRSRAKLGNTSARMQGDRRWRISSRRP
ncbi:MAG TPA: hypothetical protein VHX66_15635 [Solirubrobacteraceae bacterium]|nr:hypothetical protein [Solirubrobacteraceae bacterium]